MRLVTVTEACLYLYFPNKTATHHRQMIRVINVNTNAECRLSE